MDIKFPSMALLLLTGCTMGPDFNVPDNFAPANWFRHSEPSQASEPVQEPLETKWWSVLHDPELDRLVTRLSEENLDVQAAEERVGQSRSQRNIAAADFFPQINGDASYTREKLSDKGIISLVGGGTGGNTISNQPNGIPSSQPIKPFNIYQYGFDASWEIDLWGKVRRSVEAADANVEASKDAKYGTQVSATAELVRDYVELRSTQAQIKIVQGNLTAAQRIAELVKSRAQSGLSNDQDLSNINAQVATEHAQLPPLTQQQAEMMNAIALLLGQMPGTLEEELAASKPIPLLPPRVPVGVPSELARRRPDIRQAEAQLHEATAEIGVAKADFFPQVTLSGNGILQALEFKDLNSWAARSYMFGPSISLPIFEGGRLVSTLELRTAQEREAAITYRKTLLTAFHEVDNALTAYRSEQERSIALAAAVKHNREALALTTDRYRKGLDTFLDTLTAERDLLNSEQQETLSRQAALTDMVQLYKALGGGWEETADTSRQSAPNAAAVPATSEK